MVKEIIDLYAYDNNGQRSILIKKESGSNGYALLSGGMRIVMMRFSRTEFEQVERLCGEMGVTIEMKED